MVGPDEWDAIILVEHPSVRAFLAMTSNPEYPSDLRADALVDSPLYCTQERR